jgi:hypothetical protein
MDAWFNASAVRAARQAGREDAASETANADRTAIDAVCGHDRVAM